jgi:hypothetical protein
MNSEHPLILRAAHITNLLQTFSHPWNPNSEISGAFLGRTVGLKRTGVNFARIAPGKESFIFWGDWGASKPPVIVEKKASARMIFFEI